MAKPQKDTTGMSYSDQIAIKLKELRKARGWTIDELQKRLAKQGVTVSTPVLYAYERSTGHKISVNLIPAYCKVFELKLTEFLPDI